MPLFDLDQVRDAGRLGRIGTLRQVQRQIHELGYSVQEVQDCIASLEIGHFRKTEHYERHVECDVYYRSFARKDGSVDDLYIKLRLPPTAVPQVLLVSFHLQR